MTSVSTFSIKKKSNRVRYSELMPNWILNRALANREDRASELQRYKDIDQEDSDQQESYYFGGY